MDMDPKKNYFEILLQTAQNHAVARGAKVVNHYDIWHAITSNPETREILIERNVSPATLSREINYLNIFNKHTSNVSAPVNADIFNKAKAELLESVEDLTEVMGSPGINDARAILHKMLDEDEYELKWLPERDDTTEEQYQIQELRVGLLKKLKKQLSDSIAIQEPDGSVVELADTKLFSQIFTLLTMQLEALSPYFYEDSISEPDIFESLKDLQTHQLIPPSAVDVVEFMTENSSPNYTTLLHRNGLRVTEGLHVEDKLKDTMPSAMLQNIALGAYDLAYQNNSKEIDARHFVGTLAASSDIRIHMRKLGIKDLAKFFEKLNDALFAEENENDSLIKSHPIIGWDADIVLTDLDEIEDKQNTACEYLLHLIKTNEAVDAAFNKAGLRRYMLKKWRSAYDKDVQADNPDEKKKKKEFDISDEELESAISKYCIDYTQQASNKKFDPMIGNEDALHKIGTKLLKKGKKNPILIGEAGVGKTKVMEGLATAILKGNVPEDLIGGRLIMMDLQQMNDTPFAGVFESRVLTIVKGIAERNALAKGAPIILAIDEFAVAQNAGTHSGDPNGFRGLIKPYLTSGDIMLLSATTEQEYRQQVEKDAALARRLQPVYLKAPTKDEATQILQGLKPHYTKHHKIRIPNNLLKTIAELSDRFIHDVNQPDKSIDLLDEACAIARKAGDVSLKKDHILKAVSDKTNIPLSFLTDSDEQRYAQIDKQLTKRVMGQDDAVVHVSKALKRAKAGFKDPNTPIANFLFVGPTGVGKTELAKAVAETLMGNEDEFLVRFDMSEFVDKTSVNRFIGASAGYVGYEEGGALIKAVRSKPFAVYLYDEVEKAHPDVFNALLAPFSDGIITDGRGIKGDMRHTVNIMTSNIGAEAVMERGRELGLDPVKDFTAWRAMAKPIYEAAVHKFFRPEFINRLDGVITFDSLSPDVISKLVKTRFNQTASQLKDRYDLDLRVSPIFMDAVAKKGVDVRYGARPLKRAWQDAIETPLAEFLLSKGTNALKRADTISLRADKNDSYNDKTMDQLLETLMDECDDISKVHEKLRQIESRVMTQPIFKLK
ncbi:MAG: ATP-dependent Clp protease ATP-binding subunit [Alphaproteobacteria bacterium]|nr:ATP-dependent Clp protease ATP-binding subunit [Alphaproteobacteria bacterium]